MIGQVLLVLLILFIVLLWTRKNKIRVFYNQEGSAAHLVARMKSINKSYRPTPWCITGYMQTVFGMRYRKRSKVTNTCKRVLFKLADGGTTALDFFLPENLPEDAPFVIIAHTLGGGTREPCVNNLAEACMKKGWRAVVPCARGCSGSPITSGRLPAGIDYEDLEAVVDYVKENYKPKHIFIAGFSLGALQGCRFSEARGDKVDGIAVVSHTCDSYGGALELEKWPQSKLFTPIIVFALKRVVKKLTDAGFKPFADVSKIKSMREFDDIWTSKANGFPGCKEYYAAVSVHGRIPNMKTPTLIIQAENDPFTRPEYLPVKESIESENAVLLTTKEGGHVSFVTGLDGKGSLVDEIIPEWFTRIIEDKEAQ